MYPTIRFDIESRTELTERLCASFSEFILAHSTSSTSDAEAVFRELVVNAIIHGNCQDPKKIVRISAEVQPERICIAIEDEGKGFDYHKLAAPLLNNAVQHGYALVNACAERLEFNETGSRVIAWVARHRTADTDNGRNRQEAKIVTETPLSRKMESLGVMAGCIAHNFNNMLQIILGFAQLLELDFPPGHKRREYVEGILYGGEKAASLIKQILTFMHELKKDRQKVQLQLPIKETLRFFMQTLPDNIRLKIDCPIGESYVLADISQIHQVIHSLCANAYKVMRGKGGTLTVTMKEVIGGAAGYAFPAYLETGKPYVLVTVTDTGPGMTHEEKKNIFTATRETESLAAAFEIIRSHGGGITVETAPDQGTSFLVYFPALDKDEKEDGRSTQQAMTLAAPLVHARILLVDDVEFNAKLGKLLLEKSGYEVYETTSSRAALELVKANPTQFDVVVTDEIMPELLGHELAQAILAIRPNMPIILLTGHSDTFDANDAANLGIRKFLLKPFERAALINAVRESINPADSPEEQLKI